jgi:hypothetical protein
MKIPKNKIIKVLWHDHTSESAWIGVESIKSVAKGWYESCCLTIGKVVLDEPKYIVIANETDGDTSYGNCTMIIKSCIEKIKVL